MQQPASPQLHPTEPAPLPLDPQGLPSVPSRQLITFYYAMAYTLLVLSFPTPTPPVTHRDYRLSPSELATSLAPFVPRPPAEELARAAASFAANRNLAALLRAVTRLQPALLPAALMQQQQQQPAAAGARAGAAGPNAVAAGPNAAGAPSAGAVVALTEEGLGRVVAAVVPGEGVTGRDRAGGRGGAGTFRIGHGACAKRVRRRVRRAGEAR